MKTVLSLCCCGAVGLVLLGGCGYGDGIASEQKVVSPKSVNVRSVTKGIRSSAFKFLLSRQNEDGSYGAQGDDAPLAGTTALVLWTFASSQRGYRSSDGPFISRAAEFLVKTQQADGSFGSGVTKAWETGRAAEVLELLGKKYAPAAQRAQAALLGLVKDGALLSTGRYAALLEKTVLPRIKSKTALLDGTDWMAALAVQLKNEQVSGNDVDSMYGSFGGSRVDCLEQDPVVATAYAATIADRIRANYKNLMKTVK